MATSFDDRKAAMENKSAAEEQAHIRAHARAVRLLGFWAAEKLGIPGGEEAEKYAESVVNAGVEHAGIQDVIRKIRNDFSAKNLSSVSDHFIENQFHAYLDEVKKQMAEG